MDLESTANASVYAFSRDSGKKKRTNRSAKLKQCKLDARREQWLSQVKNKGGSNSSNRVSSPPPSPLPPLDRPLVNLETRSNREENDGSSLHESDSESLANSLSSSVSGNASGKERPGTSSCSSSGFCSRSITDEEEEEEDNSLDDWETVADALNSESKPDTVTNTESTPPSQLENEVRKDGILKPHCKETIPRAWRSDDAFRPQSLPNLAKQRSFEGWGCHRIVSQPSSCPICYEDLDFTDSNFLPCVCGFRLCLFCHKRILEDDGRCPGCRKLYGPVESGKGLDRGAPPYLLARSCSMRTRS
eukprot:TRINITY_DN21780_c0_g1_i1.p1 TRINITY_DN21780_c0_g1~~TRINITY_DN21780_c0_g1_i1.p1  ORF type:complete len:304 (+),score=29.61 TRINITY_DN21780_c0_g1_i1:169-1080(+)